MATSGAQPEAWQSLAHHAGRQGCRDGARCGWKSQGAHRLRLALLTGLRLRLGERAGLRPLLLLRLGERAGLRPLLRLRVTRRPSRLRERLTRRLSRLRLRLTRRLSLLRERL